MLRYWKERRVILSTDRGLVVLRFRKGAVELRGFIEVTFLLLGSTGLWFYGFFLLFGSVQWRLGHKRRRIGESNFRRSFYVKKATSMSTK